MDQFPVDAHLEGPVETGNNPHRVQSRAELAQEHFGQADRLIFVPSLGAVGDLNGDRPFHRWRLLTQPRLSLQRATPDAAGVWRA